jgi:O-antigen/teichoic acid export membrane protein
MNIVQSVWLFVILRSTLLKPSAAAQSPGARLDWSLQRHMVRESVPLMLNNLLASIFWRIDFWVLRAVAGATAVGIFSAGIKYLDGLNVIPSYLTLAIFPLMSRYAQTRKSQLVRAYRLAAQILFMTALPIAVFVSFAATPLIRILGGAAYLPDSALALTIMIWSTPIGFINSVTQYALISVGQQRFLTRAFLIGVTFNTAMNLIFVPRYGYLAAAIILIPAELSLFIPFYWAVRRYVVEVNWLRLLGRPAVAAALDAGATWGMLAVGAPLGGALAAGLLVYVAALLLLRVFGGEDFAPLRDRLVRRLPGSRTATGAPPQD